MANYMDILGKYFPYIEAYNMGDDTVYGNIVFIAGSPTPTQGDLDAYLTEYNAELVPDSAEGITVIGSPEPTDGDVLTFNSTSKTWQYDTLASAGISATGHTHALDDLTDVGVGSPVPQSNNVLTFNGTSWKAAAPNWPYKQMVYGSISEQSGTAYFPNDDTTPQSGEGSQIWSANITPGSTTATIKVNFSVTVDTYVGGGMGGGDMDIQIAVFRDSTCIGAMSTNVSDYNQQQMAINIVDAPSTTSQVTYSARIGKWSGATGTWYVNRLQSSRFNGMFAQQGYTLEEIDQG